MHPEQIKAEIRMRGTTPSAIADQLGLTRTTVSQVISGRGYSARVAEHIAKFLNKRVEDIWPHRVATSGLRREKKKPAARKIAKVAA